jgi:hypothetical protein
LYFKRYHRENEKTSNRLGNKLFTEIIYKTYIGLVPRIHKECVQPNKKANQSKNGLKISVDISKTT